MNTFSIQPLFPKISFILIVTLILALLTLIYQVDTWAFIVLFLLSLSLCLQFILSQNKILEVTFDGEDQWGIKLNLNNQRRPVSLGSRTKVWKDLVLLDFVDEDNKTYLYIIEKASMHSDSWRQLSVSMRSL